MSIAYIIVKGNSFQTELVPGCTNPDDAADLAALLHGEGVEFKFVCPAYGISRNEISRLYKRLK